MTGNGGSAAPRDGQRDEAAQSVPLRLVEEMVAAAVRAPSMHSTHVLAAAGHQVRHGPVQLSRRDHSLASLIGR